ncbi:hypothetical protein [Salinithrix halophila]|uniref:Uncharacterized protein n=1 Tax=Salinithrix halophila TaxID=1485204 RepID=A0ABV8JKA3_9BACL
MSKKKKKIEVREVDPVKVLVYDLKRVALWSGISVAITVATALVVESLL